MTTYAVRAALLGSHAETSFPNWVAICFSLGFPDSIFPANGRTYRPNLGTPLTEYTGNSLLKEGTPLTDENWLDSVLYVVPNVH